jgi:hypothetical protein
VYDEDASRRGRDPSEQWLEMVAEAVGNACCPGPRTRSASAARDPTSSPESIQGVELARHAR